MTEIALLEQKDLRQQAINRVEVLDKVGELFLIPKMEVMTAKQVADYFKVDIEAIKKCYQRNRNEIDPDGVATKSIDFLKGQFVPIEITQGKTTFQISNDVTLVVPNRGVRVFSKRAILRIAMLLRDSEIAKEIRTQLLNAFEHSTQEQRTFEINSEKDLQSELYNAVMNGDIEAESKAKTMIIAYQNRHITELQESNDELAANNKALAGSILKWEERACLNSAIRLIASKLATNFAFIWGDLYKELRYKHGIGLTQRGKPPYVKHIKEDEWPLVQQSLAAICEEKGISVSKIMTQAKMKS